MTRQGVKRHYGRYALATAIFIIGVVCFCVWSYINHRQDVMEKIDSALVHAAYAARELVEDGNVENLILIDGSYAPDYVKHQNKLGRLAQESGLALLGAAAHENGETYALIAESGNPEIIPVGDIRYGDALPLRVKRNVLNLARSSEQGTALLNINHLNYGLFRMAVLYISHSDGTGHVYFAAHELESVKSLLLRHAQRETAAGLFLVIMALILVRLRNTIEKRAAEDLAVRNERLTQDLEGLRRREKELEATIHDLERFSAVATGREGRILQLKAEINNLLVQLNREKRYNSSQAD